MHQTYPKVAFYLIIQYYIELINSKMLLSPRWMGFLFIIIMRFLSGDEWIYWKADSATASCFFKSVSREKKRALFWQKNSLQCSQRSCTEVFQRIDGFVYTFFLCFAIEEKGNETCLVFSKWKLWYELNRIFYGLKLLTSRLFWFPY